MFCLLCPRRLDGRRGALTTGGGFDTLPMMTIAFAGGGTGGHIYPGLAVAAALQKRFPCRVFWIGTGRDAAVVTAAGLEFFPIPAGKLRRYLSFKNLSDLFRIAAGFFAARRILAREKPALLFSKGGFVSVPPCAAAASLGIPVFTHESDYSPGLATRLNARVAEGIFTAYDETAGFLPEALQGRVKNLGNPVRPAFLAARASGEAAAAGRAFLQAPPETPILLALGGSQGARELNELVRAALPGLMRHYLVVHQTGPGLPWDLERKERYRPYPYIGEEMPQVMAASDLVLGRSGAGTLWESAALGKPLILLPLGSGTRGDQMENARCFQRAGAAVVLEKRDAAELLSIVEELSRHPERREDMAAAAGRIGSRDSASLIAGSLAERLAARPGERG